MLNYYRVYHEYYLDGKKLTKAFYGYLIDKNRREEKIVVNWDNFEEFCAKYWCSLPFHWNTYTKGIKINFFNIEETIKQWKTPNLNMIVKVIYEKSNDSISINKILEYPNGEKAIQYLAERGVSIAKTI